MIHSYKLTVRFYQTARCQIPLSKAWVCDRLPVEIVGSNPNGDMVVLSIVSVVCCHVSLRRADHSSRGVLPTKLRRFV